ncbi:MAG: hypothetical protein FWC69_06200 [Defluviitaleaceae bacterium]|nr:hypothetical protein [Defluviitaleaceae bacterium]
MKKHVFFLTLLAVVLIAISACGRDEKNEIETFNLTHRDGMPAWLLAGLESYNNQSYLYFEDVDAKAWYGEVLYRGLPTFGDEWFIPNFVQDDLVGDAPNVAYAFVRHLSHIGELDGLIDLYLRDSSTWNDAESWSVEQTRTAERARAYFWASFVEADLRLNHVIFQYTHNDPQQLTERDAVGMTFNALADRGWYFFTNSDWSRETIAYYIETSEESIRFVGDLLGYHHHLPLISIHKAPPYDGGMAKFGSAGGRFWGDTGRYRTIETVGPIASPRTLDVHTHEVAHALLWLSPIEWSNIPSPPAPYLSDFDDSWHDFGQLLFEEGFCVLSQYLFLIYTQNQRFAEGMSQWILRDLEALNIEFDPEVLQSNPGYIAYNQMGGFTTFEDFMTFMDEHVFGEYHHEAPTFDRLATRDEILTALHFNAFQILEGKRPNMFIWFYDMQAALASDIPFAALYDHYTAASFFAYLLEHRGTMEDLLRVYQDIYQAYEVYGIDLGDLIAAWRYYLDERFGEWAEISALVNESADVIWFNNLFERYEEWFEMLFATME